jgi:hypothetical protein
MRALFIFGAGIAVGTALSGSGVSISTPLLKIEIPAYPPPDTTTS